MALFFKTNMASEAKQAEGNQQRKKKKERKLVLSRKRIPRSLFKVRLWTGEDMVVDVYTIWLRARHDSDWRMTCRHAMNHFGVKCAMCQALVYEVISVRDDAWIYVVCSNQCASVCRKFVGEHPNMIRGSQ